MKIGKITFFILLVTLVLLPAFVLAAEPAGPFKTILPEENNGYLIPTACRSGEADVNACGLREMVGIAVNVSKIILGVTGSAALVMFIYGGFLWLISAGSAERVEHGRKVFEGALIGLALIFSSWVIINFFVGALSGQSPGETIQVFPNQNESGDALTIPKEKQQ